MTARAASNSPLNHPKCCATFVDYDLDGDLDLFVCRYADISLNPDKECRDPAGRLELCGPTAHPALRSFAEQRWHWNLC